MTPLHLFSNHTFSQQPSLLDQGSVIEEHVWLSVRFWVSTPLLSVPWLVTIWQEQGQNPTAQEKSAYKSVWSKELQRSPPLQENKILFTELSLALRPTILPCQCLTIQGHEGHYREINCMDIIVLPTRTNSIVLHCGLKANLFCFFSSRLKDSLYFRWLQNHAASELKASSTLIIYVWIEGFSHLSLNYECYSTDCRFMGKANNMTYLNGCCLWLIVLSGFVWKSGTWKCGVIKLSPAPEITLGND